MTKARDIIPGDGMIVKCFGVEIGTVSGDIIITYEEKAMKIDELIKILQDVVAEHGNLEIKACGHPGEIGSDFEADTMQIKTDDNLKKELFFVW